MLRSSMARLTSFLRSVPIAASNTRPEMNLPEMPALAGAGRRIRIGAPTCRGGGGRPWQASIGKQGAHGSMGIAAAAAAPGAESTVPQQPRAPACLLTQQLRDARDDADGAHAPVGADRGHVVIKRQLVVAVAVGLHQLHAHVGLRKVVLLRACMRVCVCVSSSDGQRSVS